MSSAATRHVVERCPACGVEHDVSTDSLCEACHTQLRLWCRLHGRQAGWLDVPSCPRCREEAARTPPPKPVAAPPVDAPAPRAEPRFIPTPPGRSLREILGDTPDAPAFTERGVVRALLVGACLTVLAAIGGVGLLVSLMGFVSLLYGEAGALTILALTLVFAGSLLALAVVAHSTRKRTGRRDPPVSG